MSGNDYFTVSTAWCDLMLGQRTKPVPRNPRMPVRDDMIYSYGSHFEMARAIRNEAGKTVMFLINGDTFSVTTSGHQSQVRSAIARTELPSVIIPYQALNAAGIDRDDVRILEVTSDKTIETEHVYYDEIPPGCRLYWDEIRGDVKLSGEELQVKVDKYNLDQYDSWARHLGYAEREMQDNDKGYRAWSECLLKKCPDALTIEQWIKTLSEWSRRYETHENRVIGHQLKCGRKDSWRMQYEITYLDDGRTEYRRTTSRHLLGESLIEAKLAYNITRHCKWCRDTGRAEGPRPATWIPPRAEERWHPQLRKHIRTGVIEPGFWQEERFEHIPSCSRCNGRGTWRDVRHRTAKFLSGFDANETRISYFFCELPPKSSATTVEAAYEALKPEAVMIAEEQGRVVRRQGDIYAIRLSPSVTKRTLRKIGARFEKRGSLFGTNHVATEVAYLPNGNTLVRGVLYHAPQHRNPDHARVRLDDGWFVVQKNLVPIAA